MPKRRRPIVLGIVGDSASGKTSITRGLETILGAHRVSHICTDDYHKYDRQERKENGISALHPDCNYLDILERHLESLHYGMPILKPVYDHSTGQLVRPEYVQPQEFVIVEGLLGFSTATMRQFYDVKVYLDPPEGLRKVWKIKRDTAKRGYSVEEVLAALERRKEDSVDFIQPQRKEADIVVRFYPPEGVEPAAAGPNLNCRITLRPTIPHPDLSYLFGTEDKADEPVRLQLGRADGRPADILEVSANVSAEQGADLEEAIWKHLPDLRPIKEEEFGDYEDRNESIHSRPLALTQLLITYHLLKKYSDMIDLPYAQPVSALRKMAFVPQDKDAPNPVSKG
jgi:phosphoribulokinase